MIREESVFFVKHEVPILVPVNCEKTNLSSVKRDLMLFLREHDQFYNRHVICTF